MDENYISTGSNKFQMKSQGKWFYDGSWIESLPLVYK